MTKGHPSGGRLSSKQARYLSGGDHMSNITATLLSYDDITLLNSDGIDVHYYYTTL